MIRTSTPSGIQAVGEVPFGTHFCHSSVPDDRSAGDPKETGLASGRKILVADDNRDSAESLGMLLEIAGHEICLAYDGQEALDQADRFGPEIILLDIGLPRMDGYEVAERLRRSRHRDVLLVAVTGYGTDGDRARSREAGFDHHLVKPVDPATLRDLIANAPVLPAGA